MVEITVLLPLVGAMLAGALGPILGDRFSQVVTSALVAVAAVLSASLFFGILPAGEEAAHGHAAAAGAAHTSKVLFQWIAAGDLNIEWGVSTDSLTVTMLFVVTMISAVVHVYSIGYMHDDKSKSRFQAYLSLFTFFMLVLVTSTNFVQLFVGWEGVGLCSYLLIGFWIEKKSANDAAIKAFIVNRVADAAFLIGIFLFFVETGGVGFSHVIEYVAGDQGAVLTVFGWQITTLELASLLVFVGAMGKSAQLLFHVWLPDAMEGPTPVSALIHAATMVTAGVFLMARLSPVLEYFPGVLVFVAIIGCITLLFAASVGLAQNDIKRVIAYSTCSQLGYMFLAIGASAYAGAIFHLATHAFFKALLFLGAGSVIHAFSDEQDIKRMGGAYRLIPITYGLMWVGSLALMGVPIFAGYYSKDFILESVFASALPYAPVFYIFGCLGALMTGFYSIRLIVLTFHGKPRADEKTVAHIHESPWIMLAPLMLLLLGSLAGGWWAFDYMVGEQAGAFWNGAVSTTAMEHGHEAHAHMPLWVILLPTACGLLGGGLAALGYRFGGKVSLELKGAGARLRTVLANKWYFDEAFRALFIKPLWALGEVLARFIDLGGIDRYGPNGVVKLGAFVSRRLIKIQTGFVFDYVAIMMLGVASVLIYVAAFGQ